MQALCEQRTSLAPYEWQPHEGEAYLPAALAELETQLAPASPKVIGQVLDFVFQGLNVMAQVPDPDDPNSYGLAPYYTILGDLPDDLIRLAGKRVMQTYKYNSLPKPADFYQAVLPELIERKLEAQKLRHYQSAVDRRREQQRQHEALSKLNFADYQKLLSMVGGNRGSLMQVSADDLELLIADLQPAAPFGAKGGGLKDQLD